MSINVTVKLFASLRQGRFDLKSLSFDRQITLTELLPLLGIPKEEIVIALINGKAAPMDKPLTEGDVVSLFPLIGGG